jgi:thymidylate synthase (FAD)
MKIIEQGYKIIEEADQVKKIELAARTCYKSESNITSESADKMVKNLIKSKHLAMLEHGSVILEMGDESYLYILKLLSILTECLNHPTMLRATSQGRFIISGNFRAWYEFLNGCVMYGLQIPSGLVDTLTSYRPIFDEFQEHSYTLPGFEDIEDISTTQKLTSSEEAIHRDITVKFVTDRGVSHEIVRHRIASFAQESTRYCNYAKDKFGNELTFIKPVNLFGNAYQIWEDAMRDIETSYMDMITAGTTPEIARGVLPNSIKTEIVMTANIGEWQHFFKLRTAGVTGKPHPQIEALTRPLLIDMHDIFPRSFNGVFDLTFGGLCDA